MLKLMAVTAACLAVVGCAHNKDERKATNTARGSAVRLDPAIRSACGDNEVNAYFAYDSAELTSAAGTRLDSLAACLMSGSLKEKILTITGYTDPTGSKESNLDLGKERANSVATYLEGKGVPRTRMNVASKGEAGASPYPENWAWDRVVDVSVAE